MAFAEAFVVLLTDVREVSIATRSRRASSRTQNLAQDTERNYLDVKKRGGAEVRSSSCDDFGYRSLCTMTDRYSNSLTAVRLGDSAGAKSWPD